MVPACPRRIARDDRGSFLRPARLRQPGHRSIRGSRAGAASPEARGWNSSADTGCRDAGRVSQREFMETIDRKLFEFPATPARHTDLNVDETGVVAEPEMRPQIVL